MTFDVYRMYLRGYWKPLQKEMHANIVQTNENVIFKKCSNTVYIHNFTEDIVGIDKALNLILRKLKGPT